MNFEVGDEAKPAEHKKTDSKMLTGKYDMAVLREIARLEEAALEELAELYGVDDEDDLDLEFDIHDYVSMEEGERKEALLKLLEECPASAADVEKWADSFLEKIKGLNPHL